MVHERTNIVQIVDNFAPPKTDKSLQINGLRELARHMLYIGCAAPIAHAH